MSEGLKSLNELKNITIVKDFEDENGIKRVVFASEVYKEQFDIIELALKELEIKRQLIADILTREDEDKLKAFEIIKEKRVDIRYLQECESLEQYNEMIEINWNDRKEAEYHNEILTQEEYDLLKEVLL